MVNNFIEDFEQVNCGWVIALKLKLNKIMLKYSNPPLPLPPKKQQNNNSSNFLIKYSRIDQVKIFKVSPPQILRNYLIVTIYVFCFSYSGIQVFRGEFFSVIGTWSEIQTRQK